MQGYLDRFFILEIFFLNWKGNLGMIEEKYCPVFLEAKNMHFQSRMFEAHLNTTNN